MTDDVAKEFLDQVIAYCDFVKTRSLDMNDSGIAAFDIYESLNSSIDYCISIGKDDTYFHGKEVYTLQIVTNDYMITLMLLEFDVKNASYMLKNAIYAFEGDDECYVEFFKKFFRDTGYDKESLRHMSCKYVVIVNLPLTFIANDNTVSVHAA